MKRVVFVVIGFVVLITWSGASSPMPERMPIWPEGQIPNFQEQQIAAMIDECCIDCNLAKPKPGFKPEAHRMPYLEWFDKPTNPNGTCIIFVSGGAYYCCGDFKLIPKWRDKFTNIGCQCVSLVYRTPRPKGLPIHQSAWDDGQRAVRLVRAQAALRGFDPERIGVVGMSAGAHLATLLATSSQTPAYDPVDEIDVKVGCHVNWAITGALAYALTDGIGTTSARQGDAPDVKLDSCFRFDSKTAPMCMFHGGVDVHSPFASTQVYRRLHRMQIPAELHLFADRGHNFWGEDNRGDDATGCDDWFGRAHEFMVQMGFLGPLAKPVRMMSRFASDGELSFCAEELVWPKNKVPDRQTNQCDAVIEWFVPSNLTTRAIQIVYSGDAYKANGTDGFEVLPVRRYFNAKGMTVVTLRYRTPRPYSGIQKHVTAWQDLQRAIRLVRVRATKLGLDPGCIGIMGSSAGGHLTIMGVTSSRHRCYVPFDAIDRVPCNVQWGVSVYPTYVLTDGEDGPNVTGGNEDGARLCPEFSFDLDTCPMVFVHGDDDVYASMGSVKVWEQMHRMGVQSDLHVLARCKHGFYDESAPKTGGYTVLDRIWQFLNQKGFNHEVPKD